MFNRDATVYAKEQTGILHLSSAIAVFHLLIAESDLGVKKLCNIRTNGLS